MRVFPVFEAILALGCGATALAAEFGRFNRALDRLTHFAPFYFVGGLAAFAAQWTERTSYRPITIVAALTAIVASLWRIAPEFVMAGSRRGHRDQTDAITIVQLNAWGLNRDVRGTVDWLIATKADILVLQEIHMAVADLPTLLSSAYPYRTESTNGAPCPTIILSRVAPDASGVELSGEPAGLHSTAWMGFGAGLDAFTVIGVHAPWPTRVGCQEIHTRSVAALIQTFDPASTIVSGDFNATPWSTAMKRQARAFGLSRITRGLFTWPVRSYSHWPLPALFPLFPLDHIYTGTAWMVFDVRTGPRLGSDHLPVVATLGRRRRLDRA